jgi:exodeoxyribonuclease VII small subunit
MSKKLWDDSANVGLNKILASLQPDEVSLDEISSKPKRAAELSAFCKSKFRSIEEDLEKINPTN